MVGRRTWGWAVGGGEEEEQLWRRRCGLGGDRS